MNDPVIAEVRSIYQKQKDLEHEYQRLEQRLFSLLGLNDGARKSSREMITPTGRKALFAGLKRISYERSKTQ